MRIATSSGRSAALPVPARVVNGRYSDLIECVDAHPLDRERTRKNDSSATADSCNIRREAKACFALQQWITGDGLKQTVSTKRSCGIQKRFGKRLLGMPGSFPEKLS